MTYYVAKQPDTVRISFGFHTFEVDEDGIVLGLEKHLDVAGGLVNAGIVEERKGYPRRKKSVSTSVSRDIGDSAVASENDASSEDNED